MKNHEVMHKNKRGTAIVVYDQWDLGNKYKVYVIRSGIRKFTAAFSCIGPAVKYCDKIF